MNESDFLETYGLTEKDIEEAAVTLEDLMGIVEHYDSVSDELRKIIQTEDEILAGCRNVHSTKRRLKSKRSLIRKIIRKNYKVNSENYLSEITDIIGLRAIHLSKNDWLGIHNYILDRWMQAKTPKAYLREGDSDVIREKYKKNGCVVENHRFGYRSVHYVIEAESKSGMNVLIEIQVRTIFEEGWSEVDHKYRYPDELDNNFIIGTSNILNLISGIADQITLFIESFQSEYKYSLKLTNELNELRAGMDEFDNDLNSNDLASAFLSIGKLVESIGKVNSILNLRNNAFQKAMENLTSINRDGYLK